MDRSIPTSSKLISKRIHDKNRQIHLAKLNSVKSSINCRPPPSFSHLKPASKMKNKFRDDRLAEIELENKNLLEKLTVIMKPKDQIGPAKFDHMKSLNRDHRKRELVKITIQNEAFLKRLQDQRPTYTSYNWENDYRKNKDYLKNICEYPVVPGSTKVRGSDDAELDANSFNSNTVRTGTAGVNKFSTTGNKFNQTQTKLPPVKKQTKERLDPLGDISKRVLFQTKRKIGFGNYLIHIYVHNDLFNIIASNNDRSDFKTFSVPRQDGEDIVGRFNGDYEELCNWIKFKGSKIVLEPNTEDIEHLSNIAETSTDKNEDQSKIVIIDRNSKVLPAEEDVKEAEQPKTQPNSAEPEEVQQNHQAKLSEVQEVESPEKSHYEEKEDKVEKVDVKESANNNEEKEEPEENEEYAEDVKEEQVEQDINEEEEVMSEEINE